SGCGRLAMSRPPSRATGSDGSRRRSAGRPCQSSEPPEDVLSVSLETMRVGFGTFVLDSETRELLRDGSSVHLSPKAFEFLYLLIEKRPRALSKPEIHDRLWPDTHVSEASLMTLASEVRRALGDSSDVPTYVRTVFGHGYSFCGNVTDLKAAGDGHARAVGASARVAPGLRLRWGKLEVALHDGDNVLGRTDDAVLWIDNPTVSRRHARIVVAGAEASFEDLGSKNGSWVGNTPANGPIRLKDGDRIRVGSVSMTFRAFTADTTGSMDET